MKAPAFQFYAAEWLADAEVQLMSLEEEGCYIRLLSYCWREGSIPADLSILSRLCKGGSTTLIAVVAKRFQPHPEDSSKLVHERLEKEREKQRTWREKSAEGGKKSAEKRQNKQSNRRVVEPKGNQEPEGGATLQSASSSSSSKLETPPSAGARSPTIADVKACAENFAPTSSVPNKPDQGFCEWWFDEQEKCGWIDPKTGLPWHNWRAAFTSAWRSSVHNKQERDVRAKSRSNGQNQNPPPGRNVGHNANVSYANRPQRPPPGANGPGVPT